MDSGTWDKARAAEEAGELLLAASLYARLVRQTPERPEPAFQLCLVDLRRGAAEAGSSLPTLLARFPNYAPGWEALGRFMLAAKKPEAALVCFRRMARSEAASSLLIGETLRALGRTAEARAAFADACTFAPTSVRARFLEALCAQDQADWTSAAKGYRAVLARDPERVEAQVNLGIVLQAMGDLAGAKSAYGDALRRRPDSLGRISQALTAAPRGELWLDLGQLRRRLVG